MNQFMYTGTGVEITEAIRAYVEKRLTSFFQKYTISDNQIHIEIGKSTNHHRNGEIFFAEARFRIGGRQIFARSEKEDIYPAIDHLEQEVYSQLEMIKGKKFALFKRGAQKIKEILKFGVKSEE